MNRMVFAGNGTELIPAGRSEALAPAAGPAQASAATRYLTILRRRKWLIFGCVMGAVLLGLLITLLMTPRYTASATIEIQREAQANLVDVAGPRQQATQTDAEFYQTQYGLLEAMSLAERVAINLRLFDNPQFFEMFGNTEAVEWFENDRPKPGESTREVRVRAAAEILLDNFQVVPERLSRLVAIRFTSPDPELSRRIVEAWGTNFIQATLERRFEATAYARTFLEQRLGQLRSRIDESERQVVDYAARQGIINLPSSTPEAGQGGSTQTGERSLAADDLVNLNRALAQATADRVQAQSRLASGGGTVIEALGNQTISLLRQRRAELSAEYARVMETFTPDYPPARALQSQIRQLDSSISREESRVSNTLRDSAAAATAREANLAGRVEQLKSSVLDQRRRSIQYNIFQRDADTNRQLYDALLQRYKEIGVAGGVGVNNISIVDPAKTPERPTSPSLITNLALALLLGLVIGVAIALLLEQIDQGVRDPSEIEGLFHAPLLGSIPNEKSGVAPDLLKDRKSTLSEAYYSLQARLGFATDHGVPRSLAITSTRPGEGKSTTAYALAFTLVRSGRRIVLIDADMRSPSVHHMVGIDNRAGLSNYLAGGAELRDVIRPTSIDNLFIISAGVQPPSAPELLSSNRLREAIAALSEQFDHIVIDAPPVMGLADAPLICSQVEGAVFVIEADSTHRGMINVALNRLRSAAVHVLGVTLTKFDARKSSYGYGYEYGYGYGYGARDAAKDPAGTA